MTALKKQDMTREEFQMFEDVRYKFIMKQIEAASVAIESLTPLKIKVLERENTMMEANHPNQKTMIFDSLFVVNDTDIIAIEMQNRKTEDILKRIELTYHRLISGSTRSGNRYEVPKVTIIWLVNFPWKSTGHGHEFKVKDENGKVITDNCKVQIVELTNIKHLMKKPVHELSDLEAFILYLKYGHLKENRAWVEALAKEKGGIAKMEKCINNILFDPTGYFEFKMDYERSINLAKAEKEKAKAEKANKKAEKANKKAEKEKKNAEKEKKKAEKEKKRAEKAEEKVEEEKQEKEKEQRMREALQKTLNLIANGISFDEAIELMKIKASDLSFGK